MSANDYMLSQLSQLTNPKSNVRIPVLDVNDNLTPPADTAGSDKTMTIAALANLVTQTIYPSNDTSGATDAAAINTAVANLPSVGGIVRLAPTGPWYIECGQVIVTTSGVWIDAPGCFIYAVGAGDMIRMYSVNYYDDVATGGGLLGFPTIDGSNTTGNACAFHAGDILQLQAFVHTQYFTAGTTSKGVWFDNNYYWTEQLLARVHSQHCTSNVVFDNSANTSGQATGSYDRVNAHIFVDNQAVGHGVVVNNGAILIDGIFGLYGNFGGATTQYYALDITGSNSGGSSGIGECLVNIGVENAGGSTTQPGTIHFGASGNFFISCSGILDFAANVAFTESNNSYNFSFDGPVYGDNSLLVAILPAANNYYITTGFPSGWAGQVSFQIPRADGFVFAHAQIAVSPGTVLTNGESVSSGMPAQMTPTDTTYIPIDIGGTYASLAITTGGALNYTGPTMTASGTIYLYGQTTYFNS